MFFTANIAYALKGREMDHSFTQSYREEPVTADGRKKTLIAFEGLDGSGKETQSKLLVEHLKSLGIPHRHIAFPSYRPDWSGLVSLYLNGGFGEDPEAVSPFAASSFFAADRYCSFMLDWKKDYDDGKIIVSNRYTTANAVHQLSKLEEKDWDSFLDWLYDYEFCRLGLPAPNLTIYLCLEPSIAVKYIEKRSESGLRHTDIHEKSLHHLKKSYKAAMFSASKLGWVTIDCAAGGGMRERQDIFNEILQTAGDYLK